MTRRSADGPAPIAEFFRGLDTLPDLLARRAELSPGSIAYFHQPAARWEPVTWDELQRRTVVLAAAFAQRGLRPGSRIGILAATSVDWETTQMAAFRCGAVVVGLDPYYPDTLLNELVEALRLDALVVQDATTLERIVDSARRGLHLICTVDGPATSEVTGLASLRQLRTEEGADRATAASLANADEPAVITFSSGSTGRPQPILYTHAQVVHACRCILEAYPELSAGTRLVTWLPLANLFQRMINLCATAKEATSYVVPDPRAVMDVLPVARPHVFIAVPRFCERVHAGIMERLGRRPLLVRIAGSAIELAGEVRRAQSQGARMSRRKRFAFAVADRLILARLRAVFGGELRFIVSGSAPMPRWLLEWFFAIGIPVLEAYGASENVVPIAANRLNATRLGTVGIPVGDNEVRIAADGEVQVRGAGVFIPTLGENAGRAKSVDAEGFLSTGDLGSLDEERFLTLLGRASEVFKNSQGRWISLPLIEATLRRVRGVEHAAIVRVTESRMIGVLAVTQDGRADAEHAEGAFGGSLPVRLARACRELPSAMQPIGFVVLRAGFSVATGELTTNLKLRRDAIHRRLASAPAVLAAIVEASRSGNPDASTIRYL